MSRPVIPVLAFYTAGLVVGYYSSIPFHFLILSLFTLASLTATITLARRGSLLFFTLAMLTLFILGIARMEAILYPFLARNHIANLDSNDPLSLEGRISEFPDTGIDKTRLCIDLTTLYKEDVPYPMTGRLLLTIGEKETDLRYGETVRFLARVREPHNFNNPGGFDYRKYLALKGIFATAFLKDADGIVKTGERRPSIKGWVDDMRDSIRRNVYNNGGTSAPVLLALITGDQGEISKHTREAFSKAGTAHILAISGEHVALIIMLSFVLLIWLLKLSERVMLTVNVYKIAAVITIPGIAMYSLIAGGGFSIVRSAVMGGTALAALLIDRRRDIQSMVAFAAFMILVFEPQAIFDISFQLSFASVISLMLMVPYLKRVYERDDNGGLATETTSVSDRIMSHTLMLAIVSFAATVGTAPLVAYYFNRVSIISPIANLVTVPVVGFIIVPIGLLSSLLIPVSLTVSGWLVSLDSWLISVVVRVTDLIAAIPFTSIRVVTPDLFEISLFYLMVVTAIYRKRFKWAKMFLPPVALLLITIGSFYCLRPWFQDDLRVTYLDVGQAESALIEFPGGKRMLIDGGGSPNIDFDVGEKVVAPFLWRQRIKSIDYVVVSHPNSDHYGGLPFIVRNFDVGEVWESGIEDNSMRYADFKEALKEKSLTSKIVGDGDALVMDRAVIEVLSPPKGYSATDDRAANNGSLVMSVRFGDISFLFTGDIEKAAEERLIISKGNGLKSTVVKVPHHGSLTSSTDGFLEKVQPQKAVFSVGYNNRFGFPKKAIVQRYKDIKADMYRTDRDGAIVVSSDGKTITITRTLSRSRY